MLSGTKWTAFGWGRVCAPLSNPVFISPSSLEQVTTDISTFPPWPKNEVLIAKSKTAIQGSKCQDPLSKHYLIYTSWSVLNYLYCCNLIPLEFCLVPSIMQGTMIKRRGHNKMNILQIYTSYFNTMQWWRCIQKGTKRKSLARCVAFRGLTSPQTLLINGWQVWWPISICFPIRVL